MNKIEKLEEENLKLRKENRKLKKIAYHDKLTGAYTRYWYFEHYKNNDNFNFIIVDINELKTINDLMGHIAGDELLKEVVDKLKTFGKVVRYGGDEFIVIIERFIDYSLIKDDRYSYGCCYKRSGLSLKNAFDIADKELYKMKNYSCKKHII